MLLLSLFIDVPENLSFLLIIDDCCVDQVTYNKTRNIAIVVNY